MPTLAMKNPKREAQERATRSLRCSLGIQERLQLRLSRAALKS
jgi:hypothetical protein